MSNRLDRLLELYENNSQDSFILFALAKEYEGAENYDKALSFYKILYDNQPEYTGTYYHYGSLLIKVENFDEAEKVMENGLTVCKEAKAQHAYNELRGLYEEHFLD